MFLTTKDSAPPFGIRRLAEDAALKLLCGGAVSFVLSLVSFVVANISINETAPVHLPGGTLAPKSQLLDYSITQLLNYSITQLLDYSRHLSQIIKKG